MPKPNAFLPRHAAPVHDAAGRAPRVGPVAVDHTAASGAGLRRATCVILSRPIGESSSGSHHGVPAGTPSCPQPYPESGVSGYRRVEACVGIAFFVLCLLTDLPRLGLLALLDLVEALR